MRFSQVALHQLQSVHVDAVKASTVNVPWLLMQRCDLARQESKVKPRCPCCVHIACRNIHRGSAGAFALDVKALSWAEQLYVSASAAWPATPGPF
jgi:hypothetical protein